MNRHNSDPNLKFDGEERTSMDCHNCNKNFVALLDYSIVGNHTIECPHCGHEHCRVIEGGRVTQERWDSKYGGDKDKDAIKARKVWKSNVLKAETNSASEFIRARWYEKLR
jgi:DNA-directed RNA polymerase subunit RPC12/RpoP